MFEVIAAVVAAIGGIIAANKKASADKAANEQQMQYNQQMYGMQRADALKDYAMQNDYNSPTSQMARLRAAGINPMYATGNLSTQTATVRSTDAQSYNPRPVDYSGVVQGITGGAQSALLSYYDVKQKEAALDNLKAQNTVQLEDAMLKRMQAKAIAANLPNIEKQGTNLDIDVAGKVFRLGQDQRLADTNFQIQEQELRRRQQENEITLQRNEREAAYNSMSLREAAQRIISMRIDNMYKGQQTAESKARVEQMKKAMETMDKDQQLKQLDIDLKEKGIQPTDNVFMRILSRIVDAFSSAPEGSTKKRIWDGLGTLKIN